jgi:hypothetical protein
MRARSKSPIYHHRRPTSSENEKIPKNQHNNRERIPEKNLTTPFNEKINPLSD